ncbi:MAG: dihydrodipicolinate reductase [Desulfobacterales bacterium]
MKRLNVMVNGLPGDMAQIVAGHILADDRFELLPFSLTGPEIQDRGFTVQNTTVKLVQPDQKEQTVIEIKESGENLLSVDFTHPSAVNSNVAFYCNFNLPFVMGTTGGDRRQLEEAVVSSSIAAVIAPNMAKQIVGFQAMMDFAASNFPDLFNGYSLKIEESHQKGKADTSGTAKAMVSYFNKLGIPFSEKDIIKERDPNIQASKWGIPEAYLKGHGWHRYSLLSQDQTVRFTFSHNVNGRDVYAKGTLDALLFLSKKLREGATGKMYTMIDVLKGT